MNDLNSDIVSKLRTICPEAKVYRANVDGGFTLPAFYLQLTNVKRDSLLANDQLRTYSFQIVFFPKNQKNPMPEIQAMDNQMLDNFISIDSGHIVNLSTKEVDETLVTTFDITTTARYVEESNNMKNVHLGDVNNG